MSDYYFSSHSIYPFKKISCFVKASTWKVQILMKMNCTFQKKQTVFILFATESVIFILTQLNESCVCLPKGMLKRQKCASKIEKRFIKIAISLFIVEKR